MIRRALLAAAAASTLALSACGAEEASVVKSAFEHDIKSADVTVALSMKSSQGETGLALSGPFESNGEGRLPSVDWTFRLDGGLPRPIEGRVISTGDDAFVEYGGETYRVGKDKIGQLGALGGAGGGVESADLGKLMSRMQDWFPESDAQSDAELDGEPVTRITGKLDLSAALKDMKELSKQGVSGFEGLQQLPDAQLEQVEKLISDPTCTVDVARSDGKLRRIAARMTIDDGSGEQGTVSFSIQLKDVDQPVTITAPSSGKPIEELMRKLQQDFGATAPAETTIS